VLEDDALSCLYQRVGKAWIGSLTWRWRSRWRHIIFALFQCPLVFFLLLLDKFVRVRRLTAFTLLQFHLQSLNLLFHLSVLIEEALKLLLRNSFIPDIVLFFHQSQLARLFLWIDSFLFHIQKLFKVFNLLLKLVDCIGIGSCKFCRFDLEGDMVSPFDKFQSIDSLLKILYWRRKIRHNKCIGISCKRFLQESSQLRLTENPAYLFISTWKSINNFA